MQINNKQRWDKDKCRCECKELIDESICGKGFIWNPSNCECEFDKSCNVGEYLGYWNCKCIKRSIDKLVEECSENIDEYELHLTLNDYEDICSSFTVYVVLFVIFFVTSISISRVIVYFYWYLKSETNITNINAGTEKVIYWTQFH